jgi:hypothetical protein
VDESTLERTPSSINRQRLPPYEIQMFWHIRWFFAITLACGYLASIITGIVGFVLTKNPYFLSFISPSLLTPAILYLIPMDEKRFQLKALRIQARMRMKLRQPEEKYTKEKQAD